MAKILVNNNGPLHGEVTVSGAKNSVLPLMAATLLTKDTCVIEGAPDLVDVKVMKDILRSYGAKVDNSSKDELRVSAEDIVSVEGDPELVGF